MADGRRARLGGRRGKVGTKLLARRARPVDHHVRAVLLQFENLQPVLDEEALQHEGRVDPRTVQIDAQGHRLGSGAGYYDRALSFRRRRHGWRGPKLIGIAYECQRVAALAARPTDIPLDAVITERGIEFFIGETT